MKRDKVVKARKAAPVRTFLAHWGVFLTLVLIGQMKGYVVIYPKPVLLVEANQQSGDWLSSLTR